MSLDDFRWFKIHLKSQASSTHHQPMARVKWTNEVQTGSTLVIFPVKVCPNHHVMWFPRALHTFFSWGSYSISSCPGKKNDHFVIVAAAFLWKGVACNWSNWSSYSYEIFCIFPQLSWLKPYEHPYHMSVCISWIDGGRENHIQNSDNSTASWSIIE